MKIKTTFNKMIKSFNKITFIKSINTSRIFAGLVLLILNLFSKFITIKLSDSQEALFTNVVIRRFVIFTVVFMATKDLLISLVLTAVFIVLVSGLFNENSKYCIIKKRRKKKINKKEYQEAKKIIQLYELQKLNE